MSLSDTLAAVSVVGVVVSFVALVVYDACVETPLREAKALQEAEVLVNDKPATVYRVTDRLTGRTFRAVRVNAEGAAVILPDAPAAVEAGK